MQIDWSQYSDVEVVTATCEEIPGSGGTLRWVCNPEMRINKGDAVENFPTNSKLGDVVEIHIIRGYAQLAGIPLPEPRDIIPPHLQDDRTEEELAAEGITIDIDEHGKRHIKMRADPHIELRGGPVSVECPCGAKKTFTESGPTNGWVPPHGGLNNWTCPECAPGLSPISL